MTMLSAMFKREESTDRQNVVQKFSEFFNRVYARAQQRIFGVNMGS